MQTPQNPPKSSQSPWDADFESMTQDPDPEVKESAYISEPEINRPLHKNPFLKFPVILLASLTAITAVAYLFFGGTFAGEAPNLVQKTDDKGTTLGISDQERLANAEAKSAMGGTDKAFASHLQPVSNSSPAPRTTSVPVKAKPTTKLSPSVVAKAPPQPRIVYRTITPKPVPIKPVPIKRAPAKPIPSPRSFISLGNGQQAPRREKKARPKRQPLASEKTLLDNLPSTTLGGDPLIAGQTISVHLMSTLLFTNQGQTPMQVMLDRPLKTIGGGQIPGGSILLFDATVNPQNGAISAVSGDAVVNGKTIRIQKGAMSLELTNKQRTSRSPLVAQSVNLKEGELANADRNNALMGIAGGIGEELTKGSASVTVGNGSTIIQQGNNGPNIWGGVLKGASQTVLNDQRQRTQTKAAQILAAPPIQSLQADTPILLTVTFPAPISPR